MFLQRRLILQYFIFSWISRVNILCDTDTYFVAIALDLCWEEKINSRWNKDHEMHLQILRQTLVSVSHTSTEILW